VQHDYVPCALDVFRLNTSSPGGLKMDFKPL
jgi:hypothetical protein